MAKVHPYYGNDGTGRDTYIQSRNGGVFGKLHQIRGTKFFTGTLRQQRQLKSPVSLQTKFKVNYHADGTGRDTYVNGGSFFPYMGGCDYVNQLRKKNNSFISRAQTFYATKTNELFISRQKAHSNRMSMPKPKQDQYKQMRTTFRKLIGQQSSSKRTFMN